MTREEAILYLTPIMESARLVRYKDALGMVIDALRAQQDDARWISVKDGLPKYGTVLATDGVTVITAPSSSVTRDGPAITHWMPLPEPPEKEVVE